METLKTVTSEDGRQRVDIERTDSGLYRYVMFDDRYRDDPDFQKPPYWSVTGLSGLYDTADAAESDAKVEFPWLGV